ncbi:hymenoptaecin [Diachasma alloeum]|uniref:hymenoptaecin n=1 Tax=Diachasma alloeum TaxID=454923 RepID=UPI0007382641|nr:hymenoptaecin [Diachasma alloeum]
MKVFGVEIWLVCATACMWSIVQCDPVPQPSWVPPRPGQPIPRPGLPGPTFPRPGQPGPPIPRPGPGFPHFPRLGNPFDHRFRRSPQGSVQGGITIPEHGRPQANVDYKQRVLDNGKSTLDTYGGVSTNDGRHFQPHAGAAYEYRPRDNVVVRGQGSVQKGPGGRFEPQFGVGVGLEF